MRTGTFFNVRKSSGCLDRNYDITYSNAFHIGRIDDRIKYLAFLGLRHVLAVVGRERAAGACEIHHRAVFHREKHCEIGKIAVALGAIIRGFPSAG